MGKLDSEHAYDSCSPCSSLARNTNVPMSARRRWVTQACQVTFWRMPQAAGP